MVRWAGGFDRDFLYSGDGTPRVAVFIIGVGINV